MQIKKDYTKMIEQFEKMEKEKQAAIPTISFDNNKIVHLPGDFLNRFQITLLRFLAVKDLKI